MSELSAAEAFPFPFRFRCRYLAPAGDRLRVGLGGRCVFLEDGAVVGCGIYPVRPVKCRTWPGWPELAASASARTAALRLCPGLEPIAAPPR